MALVDFVLYKGKPHFLKVYRPVDVLDQKLDEACGDRDLGEIGGHGPIPSERLREVGSRLNKEVSECLAEDTEGRAKKLRTLETEQLPRLERYERQLDIAGDRGSYSKTDHDATFMGMKEDPMRNHQLKASCNVQMGTEGQFIVGFSVHQASTDTALLIPHLDNLQETLGRLPSVIVADAGYGSEENYGYLEGKGIPAYVKYSTFHQEKRRAWRRDPFRKENFPYDVERDTYTCPCGDELRFEAERNAKTRTGHVQTKRIYRASHCPSCPYRKHCAGGEACRSIQVNRRLDCFRDQARGFRRFLTRGLAKVRTEWGLFSLAYNILKVCTIRSACRA